MSHCDNPINHPPSTSARYMPQLDGLRAIAVFVVAWSHWMWDHTAGLPWGHFGVQLFFVLSGFLITGILLRAKPEPGESRGPVLKQFFIRRALRIFPAYYLVLAIAWLANFEDIRSTLGWHATYTTNIYLWWNRSFNPLSHFWTLAVEEQFYLIWPWVVLWSSPRTLLRIVIAMIIVTPFFQAIWQSIWPQTEPTMLMPCAADALGVGALLALAETFEEWRTSLWRVQILVCVPIFFLLQSNIFLQAYGLPSAAESVRKTTMVVAFSLLVSQAATGYRGPVGWVLSHPLMTGIGKISYGIYLIHNFTPHLVTWFLDQTPLGAAPFYALPPGWRFVVFWVTTVALAGASWFLIERPCLRLKDRWGTR